MQMFEFLYHFHIEFIASESSAEDYVHKFNISRKTQKERISEMSTYFFVDTQGVDPSMFSCADFLCCLTEPEKLPPQLHRWPIRRRVGISHTVPNFLLELGAPVFE